MIVIARDRHPLVRSDTRVLYERLAGATLRVHWVLRGPTAGCFATADGAQSYDVGASLPSRVGAHARASVAILARRHDLVQCRDVIVLSAWYALLARIARRPFLYWMSFPMELGYAALAAKRPWWQAGAVARRGIAWLATFLLDRWTLPSAAHVFAQSERMKATLIARGVPAGRVTPVEMGIDPAVFRADGPAMPPAGVPAATPAILYVGSLDPTRELGPMLEGVRRALVEVRQARFVVAGALSVAEAATLRAALGAEAARLVTPGALPPERLASLVRWARVCISAVPNTPLFDVSTPTKMVEYAACGAEIVANRLPDHEQVAAATGLVRIVEDEASDYARALIAALSSSLPSPERRAAAAAWAASARGYDPLAARVRRALDGVAA